MCAARPPRRASASSPPPPSPPGSRLGRGHAPRPSVCRPRSARRPDPGARRVSTGAGLKPALVGEQRVVHLPERVLTRRRLGRRPPGRAQAGRRRCRDIDQVGCRLRYRDLREAGVSEVLRQLPQFARSTTRHPRRSAPARPEGAGSPAGRAFRHSCLSIRDARRVNRAGRILQSVLVVERRRVRDPDDCALR